MLPLIGRPVDRLKRLAVLLSSLLSIACIIEAKSGRGDAAVDAVLDRILIKGMVGHCVGRDCRSRESMRAKGTKWCAELWQPCRRSLFFAAAYGKEQWTKDAARFLKATEARYVFHLRSRASAAICSGSGSSDRAVNAVRTVKTKARKTTSLSRETIQISHLGEDEMMTMQAWNWRGMHGASPPACNLFESGRRAAFCATWRHAETAIVLRRLSNLFANDRRGDCVNSSCRRKVAGELMVNAMSIYV